MCNKTRCNQGCQHRHGVATVEMAMIVPVIFLLIFGSIEFSRMMMVRQALTNAGRAGSRTACLVTTQTSSKAENAIRDSLSGVISDASDTEVIRMDFDPPISSSLASGTPITVTVEVDCSDVSWLPPFFTSGATIRGTSTMKRE